MLTLQQALDIAVKLQTVGQLSQAERIYRQIIDKHSDCSQAWNNLGGALVAGGRYGEALDAYRQAVAAAPQLPDPHFNLGIELLRQGQFEEGWKHYDWRLNNRPSGESIVGVENFPQPKWDRRDPKGLRIMLHGEQGLGDAIQMIRYAPLLSACGATVLASVPKELRRLFQTIEQIEHVTSGGERMRFHMHCPLLSLPQMFSTKLETIPCNVPYLKAERQLSERWHARLGERKLPRRIGLVWSGSAKHSNDRNRSIQLSRLSPLAQIPDAEFFSLQKGDAAKQISSAPMPVADFTSELDDFADTAALLDNLDLLITVDTAMAHLAGAMGKPVWVFTAVFALNHPVFPANFDT